MTFERSLSANLCVAPCTYTWFQHSVLLRRPPPGANSLPCFFFFFFLIKNETNLQVNLSVEFGSEKICRKNGNLDLENFNKSRNGQFLNKEFGSTLCDKLSHMVWEGGEGSYGWLHREVIL